MASDPSFLRTCFPDCPTPPEYKNELRADQKTNLTPITFCFDLLITDYYCYYCYY